MFRIFLVNFGYEVASVATLEEAKIKCKEYGFESVVFNSGKPIAKFAPTTGWKTY